MGGEAVAAADEGVSKAECADADSCSAKNWRWNCCIGDSEDEPERAVPSRGLEPAGCRGLAPWPPPRRLPKYEFGGKSGGGKGKRSLLDAAVERPNGGYGRKGSVPKGVCVGVKADLWAD